jgi:hypothetical protein
MKIPVKFSLNNKPEKVGFLTPVTGMPNTWWLHDKKDSYMIGILRMEGNTCRFTAADNKEYPELAALLAAKLKQPK